MINNPLYTLNPTGRIDRRKMIYRNIPTQELTQARETIKFNTTEQQWECIKCNRKASTQNKRNLIQHAITGHKPPRQQIMQKIGQTTKEKELTKTRIRTLQINTKGHKETLTLENTEAEQKTQENTQQQQEEQKTTSRKTQAASTEQNILGKNRNGKKIPGQTNWKCQMTGCAETPKNHAAIGQHISKKHNSHTLTSKQITECTFCRKSYTYLEPMLIHLELKTGKQQWQPCQCPLKPKNLTGEQIWKTLLRRNAINMERNNQALVPIENRTKEQKQTKLPQKQHKQETTQPCTYQTMWEKLGLAKRKENKKWQCAIQECKQECATTTTLAKHIYAKHEKHLPKNPKQPQKCPKCDKEQANLKQLLEHLSLIKPNNTAQCTGKTGETEENLIETILRKQPNRQKRKRPQTAEQQNNKKPRNNNRESKKDK